jgi:hypothetical protein
MPTPPAPPDAWPYSSEAEWKDWRRSLDQADVMRLPNLEHLKTMAENELARIERCRPAPVVRPRTELVPSRSSPAPYDRDW